MSRLISFALFLSVLIGFSSCGEDDLTGYVPESNGLAIVRNTLSFGAQGGTEAVEVSTTEPVTFELSADWCSATVAGATVSVTAQPNTGYESRTALLTLRAGGKQRRLAVQQQGSIIGILPVRSCYAANEGTTFTYNVTHDPPMTVTTASSWIHPVMEGNKLTIVVDDNTGGHIRRGYVASECGGVRDTMLIAQYSIDDDIVGSYYMAGTYNGNHVATRFDILLRDGSLAMHFTSQPLWMDSYPPVRLDEGTCTLIFMSGMTLYSHGSTTETAYFYDADGAVTTAAGRGACAELAYNESTGFNQAVMQTYNWPGHKLGGFLIRSSSASGLVVVNLLQLNYPTLSRVGAVGATLN